MGLIPDDDRIIGTGQVIDSPEQIVDLVFDNVEM
jgi:hypothetical protein